MFSGILKCNIKVWRKSEERKLVEHAIVEINSRSTKYFLVAK